MHTGSRWLFWGFGIFFVIVQALSEPVVQPSHAGGIGSLSVVSPDGQETIFSESEFLALPKSRTITRTAWTEDLHVFEGVALGKVLETAGIDPQDHQNATVRAIALNDYVVEFPLADATRYGVLIAAFMDGRRLSVSDKGPYWIVYPRDDFRELRDSRFDHRWAWQLRELQIR
ncbi:molybdopterin-dependent oxidoreductase [Nitratireductor aquimarinus]|uniref:molybdopterin-dependent oxidoreductase n=1 Tax=Alphaproteobacteria TaxID=28211 RepID=UPI0019D3D80A|nr:MULTISPECIES: molybdopterin-dependent oxidoreductase [Alphaproteobacteria]MBN7759213.1 molybdopterin-dependent oxidoreductase [Nitratireductor aquimarinus]MBY6002098.1 molybdopterin-dependent oxidoreductase [Tritonibacter mobilis]MBY6024504.1 molybdopterin-dependent oxidoreductase [Nitratireductor sp. DP7N14-4]